MSGIIVVFPKIEDAKSIRNLLVRRGFDVIAACTTGAQALNYADAMGDGLVVSGYRLGDMTYLELRESLPDYFAVLLLASRSHLAEREQGDVVCVPMPLKVHELVDTINMIQGTLAGRRRKRKERMKTRDPREREIIEKAKKLLMERNCLSEEEAHRYVQKRSMDSGTNMVETAEMILSILDS